MATSVYEVVVGVDFGTCSSTFAYSHKSNSLSDIVTNDIWPQQGQRGVFKTNTILFYNSQTWNVVGWGSSAITRQEKKKKKKTDNNGLPTGEPPTLSVSLFKLFLGNAREQDKPILPQGLSYRQCVIDYLAEMTKLIKTTIATRWPGINFYKNVLIVLTVPADFSERAKAIMRDCAFKAGLLQFADSPNLEFTTEPEAAAIHCITSLRQLGLKSGANFMIVDCGVRQVKQTFSKYVHIIEVPSQPITAVVRGAVQYGLNMRTIQTRVLRYTYGVQVLKKWKKGDDPRRKTHNGLKFCFHELAKRGTEVKVNQTFGYVAKPSSLNQIDMTFNIYATTNFDAKYCDDPNTKHLGTLKIDLPDIQLGK
ncbi:unnamed protein product [Rhizophagus irregularis]|nr:unnamed protein product [Rhizophagus irregularis]